MKKRLLTVLLLCAAFTLSACGNAAQKSAAPQTGAENPEKTGAEISEETVAETPEETVAENSEETPDDGGAETVEEADAIFAPLVGVWTPEQGMGILTIYQNGGFLFDADDALEGYLVYTEEDGEGLWDSGPRYELYLENNERVPDCYFALDDANPGKLVYAVGGGAELFSRPDSVYDDSGVILRVVRVDEEFFAKFAEVQSFVHDGSEYSTEIAFCAERDLPDFKFLSIAWVDSNEDGSFFTAEELYSLDALTPERPLIVQTSFPGDMPTDGVSFTDADGATRYYALLESGYNGSLVLSEFSLSE